MTKRMLVIMLIFLFAAGCAKTAKKPEAELYKMPETKAPEKAVERPPMEVKEPLTEEQIARVETAAVPEIYKEKGGITFEDVHFDYDRYEIKAEDIAVLKSISDWMLKNPSKRLLIEGHCDERGTGEYNLALGDRRATSVKNYLSAAGVAPSRILTVSFGEEKPLCMEQDERCWFANRRAHFMIIED